MGAVVQDKFDKGCYYVDGQTWQVGTRYTLIKVLGCGSFSSVVSAFDNETQEQVALKRIPDVLNNGENAKRVLREVCILRRLSHPHIIGLKDVFLKPSSTGRYVYKGGKLVATSLDLYLALEYCDQGDLFHMRGQLSESEVKTIMLQLLAAVQYLHRNGVWHRDIKSANILMTYTNGMRHIKLADLGSARSVLLERHLKRGSAAAAAAGQHHAPFPVSSQQQPHSPSKPPHSALTAALVPRQAAQVNQATQTSSSAGAGAALGGGASDVPCRQRSNPHLQQGSGLPVHSRHGSMDSISSAEQQQQQQGGGLSLPVDSRQQQQPPQLGSSSSRLVSSGPAGGGGAAAAQGGSSAAVEAGGVGHRSRLVPSGPPMQHSDSFLIEAHSSPSDIYARPVAGGGGGFKSPLTRMVCTPCYRAPEVVMSRGGYTEAIDMWGCGCVFGELIQRVAWIGKATTPQLQVAPVFAIHGIPQTPVSGERFMEGPGNNVTRTELAALFAVIGTPSWRCIESVDSPAWRRYLRKIPGRAPTLFRRFGSAGEVAVDLMARLLTFDPVRRCTSEEAIAHEYFEDMLKERAGSSGNLAALLQLSNSGELPNPQQDQELGQGGVCNELEAEIVRQQQEDEEMQDWEGVCDSKKRPKVLRDAAQLASIAQVQTTAAQDQLVFHRHHVQVFPVHSEPSQSQPGPSNILKRPRDNSLNGLPLGSAAEAPAAASVGPFASATSAAASAAADSMEEDQNPQQQLLQQSAAALLPPLPPGKSGVAAAQQQHQREGSIGEQPSFRVTPSGQHYYELDDPAAALAALENDMAALMSAGREDQDLDVAPGGPPPQAPQPLRELLEREVAEHSSHLEKRRRGDVAKPASAEAAPRRSSSVSPLLGSAAKRSSPSSPSSIRTQWQHLQPDPGPTMDPSRIGFQRLPHHADAEQGHLDPQQHLRAGRHGEWMADTLQVGSRTNAGNVWGVSLVPSGYSEETHPELAAIIRHQHTR